MNLARVCSWHRVLTQSVHGVYASRDSRLEVMDCQD